MSLNTGGMRVGRWGELIIDLPDLSPPPRSPGKMERSIPSLLSLGDLMIDGTNSEFVSTTWKGIPILLSAVETSVVQFIASRRGVACSYRQIYDVVHYEGFVGGSGEDGYQTNVRSCIKRINTKFQEADPTFGEIHNLTSFGYHWGPPSLDMCEILFGHTKLAVGLFTVYLNSYQVFFGNTPIPFTVTEVKLFYRLAENAGQYVRYRAVYDVVHRVGFIAGKGEDGYRTNVRSAIRRMREKLQEMQKGLENVIETSGGFGYRLRAA